jgi:hypothetical protein
MDSLVVVIIFSLVGRTRRKPAYPLRVDDKLRSSPDASQHFFAVTIRLGRVNSLNAVFLEASEQHFQVIFVLERTIATDHGPAKDDFDARYFRSRNWGMDNGKDSEDEETQV